MTVNTLKVPGASLYHEVVGEGPTLLMIPGGATDASVFAGIAGQLADRYTVVTYDARGNSRSELDGPATDQRLDDHVDDARRLLGAVSDEPGYVLGSSGGAIVGLELAIHHPGLVRTLVAHEPPVTELLPDAARYRALSQEMYEIYRSDGVGAAMAKFMAVTGLGGGEEPAAPPPADPSPEAGAAMARIQGNMEFFLAHSMRMFEGYVPDAEALKAVSTRVVIACGEESTGQAAHDASVALAALIGTDVWRVPGDHGGYGAHPVGFAAALDEAFRAG